VATAICCIQLRTSPSAAAHVVEGKKRREGQREREKERCEREREREREK
jgi:hypothetical protein